MYFFGEACYGQVQRSLYFTLPKRSPQPMSTQKIASVSHEVVRWSIDTGTSFEDFRDRYEAAVPVLDLDRMARHRAEHASWDTVLAAATENAPHGFMRFWSTDVGGLMQLAGNAGSCAAYLMGNHTIAERMYRHDPAVMLHAPLRTTIHQDGQGVTRFSLDQPSTLFASFGVPEIAAVGRELDRKVADLLRVLDVPVLPQM
ncbi:DUF302 domain-containing protein [Amycolatopsis sp. DSM 110486]|uniref:DUF302 domain-containing protein n=1 Tax=Amycolatopsis sp. DSM 110486 TaxID=2865832 RepID=UPI001C6A493E|nr:DUF302 domain-containing protein [Amycolatopsis sp. DSM 110486]QYN18607.1 DUF302 domain-containing protein [Amycolatopsis sp. DSM 110486]